MFAFTSSIYISIGQAPRRESDGSGGSPDSHYRRQMYKYLVTIEPHQLRIPGLSRRDVALTHFEAIRNESGVSALVNFSSKTAPSIIGNILVADAAHATPDKIHKVLSAKLAASQAKDEDSYVDDGSEHLLRSFLHALQDGEMIAKFDIDEFTMWTHSYVADRLSGEAPTVIAYPRAHKDHLQRKTKAGFRVSYPMRDQTRSNGSSKTYGGLM